MNSIIKKSLHLFKNFYIVTSISLSIPIFLVLYFILNINLKISLVLSFNLCALLFLILSVIFMFKAKKTKSIKERAKVLDEGKWVALFASLFIFCVIMCGFYIEIYGAKNKSVEHIVLGVSSIFLAWVFICFLFAQHYAHEYYLKDEDSSLDFPDTQTPDYWDFLYFSVGINMCFQTADVRITSSSMRKLVMLQSLIAFSLNIVIISTSINVIAGMLNN